MPRRLPSDLVTLAPVASARNTVQPTGAAVVPLVVKGFAAQSAKLQEWQDSTGAVKMSVDAVGKITCGDVNGSNFNGQYLTDQNNTRPYINTNLATDTMGVVFRLATNKFVVKGAGSQTGNLQEWEDSAAAILSRIDKDGYYMTRKVAAPADAAVATSELAVWFDDTNGAAKLMIKAKEAGGTVRTGSVALT